MSFDPIAATDTVWYKMQGDLPIDPATGHPFPPPQSLISLATAQYAYGQEIGVSDPAVYAYEALGMALANNRVFNMNYQPPPPGQPTFPASPYLSDQQFVPSAYNDVFGHAGSPDQLQVFVNQLNYVESLNAGTPQADLIARGAVYGTMIGIVAEITQVPVIGISTHV